LPHRRIAKRLIDAERLYGEQTDRDVSGNAVVATSAEAVAVEPRLCAERLRCSACERHGVPIQGREYAATISGLPLSDER
jgi:hypothetical protein